MCIIIIFGEPETVSFVCQYAKKCSVTRAERAKVEIEGINLKMHSGALLLHIFAKNGEKIC